MQYIKASYFINQVKFSKENPIKIKNLSVQSFRKWFKINEINQN